MAINYTDEQRNAIMRDKGNILVSASAGSGKTFVMIERLIRLIIDEKTDVENVLAVTFTQLAAQEMKTKLADALTKKINDDGISDKTRARLKEQLADVPMASVSTFHSFCRDLIRNYFFEAGVDALFSIADETQSEILKAKAIDDLFSDLYGTDDESFKTVLRIFIRNRNDAFVKELIIMLYEFFQNEASPEQSRNNALNMYSEDGYQIIKAACFAQYRDIFDNYYSSFKKLGEKYSEIGAAKTAEACNVLAEYSRQISFSRDLFEMAKMSNGVSLTLPRFSPQSEEEAVLKETLSDTKTAFLKDAKELKKDFDGEDETYKHEILSMRPVAEKLIWLVREFENRYSTVKKEENVLDFSDLEHTALKLLENDRIRNAVKSRYEYIFADEYQDTNGVQEAILSKITNDNLFMVGDVKQSIYAFRGCDPGIFEEKFSKFSGANGGGSALTLDANFRSSSAVLRAVNGTFGNIMSDAEGRPYSERPMTNGNGTIGSAVYYVIPKEEKTPKSHVKRGVYSVKEHLDGNDDEDVFKEAALIAKIINDNLNLTVPTKDGGEKKTEYDDIVILSRGIAKYGKKLAENLSLLGIPVSSDDGNQINSYPEIKHLISVLRIIDCAEQDIHLVASMRGPFGNFSDGELASIRKYSDKYYVNSGRRDESTFSDAVKKYMEENDDELSEKLVGFFDYLENLRFLSDFIGAGGVLSKIVREKKIDLYYLSEIDGRARAARISRLIDECSANENLAVKEFLKRFDAKPDAFKLGGDESTGAVKLMTIHASKGLEFPVVILCGISNPFNSMETRNEIYTNKKYGFALKTYDEKNMTVKSNMFRKVVKRHYSSEQTKEEIRILYVAMTRAKSRLYLTQTGVIPPIEVNEFELMNAKSYADLISSKAMPVEQVDVENLLLRRQEGETTTFVGSETNRALANKIKSNLQFVYPYDVTIPAKSSVTAIVSDTKEQSDEPPVPVIFSSDDAREKGVAYHRAMELLDFSKFSEDEISTQIKRCADEGLMTAEQAETVDSRRLAALLKSDFFRMPNAKYYREQPFEMLVPANMFSQSASSDEVLVQGVIDLMVVCEEGIHIADYKVSSHSSERLAKDYFKQLELYAYAASRITGKKILSKTLFNLMRGEKTEL